jgi:hypothetical protein
MNPEKRPSSASSTCSLFAVRCLLPGEGELMNPEKMTFLLLLQPARCLLLTACFPEVERDHE